LGQTGELLKKSLPVLVTFEYRFAVDLLNDDMMQGARGIYASQIEMRYFQ
jgi:hypothetical protein